MTMADDNKDGKKKAPVEDEILDDLFGDMDVLGERKEVEPKEEKKLATHSKIDPRPALAPSEMAEKSLIWLTVHDKTYTLEEISPEDFAEWVHDKLPGMRKIDPAAVRTVQRRRDIFEEVIAVLEHWFYQAHAEKKNNLY